MCSDGTGRGTYHVHSTVCCCQWRHYCGRSVTLSVNQQPTRHNICPPALHPHPLTTSTLLHLLLSYRLCKSLNQEPSLASNPTQLSYTAHLPLVVDLSISMMSVLLLWMGSGVAVEANSWFAGSATNLTQKSALAGFCWTFMSSASFALCFVLFSA